MLVKDGLYGSFDIRDGVLLELIESRPVQRLKGVSQHGIPEGARTDFITFSRYEHSIGVMLLLKRLDAELEEQIAGLLHDVSHTAFSHVGDWVFGEPSRSDYQDTKLENYIKNSEINEILSRNGFDVQRISRMEHDKNYGLLERDAPDLCADRVDYCLRDGSLFFRTDVKECIDSLAVHEGEIVFSSIDGARFFGNLYAKCQAHYWMHNEHMLRYSLLADVLKLAMAKKILQGDQMYGADNDVIKILKDSNDDEILRKLDLVINIPDFVPEEDGNIEIIGKIRYVDPKFLEGGVVSRLSMADEAYKKLLDNELKRMSRPVRGRLLPGKASPGLLA